MHATEMLVPLAWDDRAFALRLLDQRQLPHREVWLTLTEAEEVASAIRDMAVRGAPAIGLAAAYGMVLAAKAQEGRGRVSLEAMQEARTLLAGTRPTAVNLFWALRRMSAVVERGADAGVLLEEAKRLHAQDIDGNRMIAATGADRIEKGMGVLTHCNAGALATGGVGTALGVIAQAHAQGKEIHVYVDETRPRLQGARLTAWELSRLGVPHTLVCDNMAASLMARGRVQLCVTGADRIAENGDVANKIGTYGVAVAAKHHGLPFYVAAPRSTFDLGLRSGEQIPIEERDAQEITQWGEETTAPLGTRVWNPSFDVTPAGLVRAIFTDVGPVDPVNAANIRRVLHAPEVAG